MPSLRVRVYVGLLCLVAAVLTVVSIFQVDRLLDLLWFAALYFFADSLKLRSRLRGDISISLASVIAIAMYAVLGPWGGPALLSGLFVSQPGIPVIRRFHNISLAMICSFLGGLAYIALGGPVGEPLVDAFPRILLPVMAANLVYHSANLVLMTIVLRLDSGVSSVRMFRAAVRSSVVASVGYGFLGLALAVLWLGNLGPVAAVLLLVPLMVGQWTLAQYAAEQKAHQATMRALAQAIETKDVYTRGHGERVSLAARMLGVELGWQGDRLDAVAEAGLLHDVGKIGVPTRVLQKDGRLTEEEYEAIKAHPLHGVALVSDIAFLEDARAGIMHHHERYDGRGYPSGLAGEGIPVFARVLSIADAFDCMTSVRSYRPARPVDEAIEELIRCKDSQFDPDLVEVFVRAIRAHGWQSAPALQVQPGRKARAAAYDHDDPSRPPQVEDSRGSQ